MNFNMGVLFSITGNDTSARMTATAAASTFAPTLFLLALAPTVAPALAPAPAPAVAIAIAPPRSIRRHLHGTLKLMTH